MKSIRHFYEYFSKLELILWVTSVSAIVISFCIFDRSNFGTLIASLIGVTAIIFGAKGNPIAQVLMIIFSIIYGYISFHFAYYGEMITYLGMTMPMAIVALISWIRHPFAGNKSEVEVNKINKKETIFMFIASLFVTVIFYFILKYFHTTNIIPSTLSITTSFIAVFLTFKRSPYFSIAYALNDIVLVILWVLATMENVHYASMAVCFVAFLFNDIYAFISWKKIEKRQAAEILQKVENQQATAV